MVQNQTKMQIRPCQQVYNGVFGREKRRFSKTGLREEFFKKIPAYWFWCGENKVEVFEHTKKRMTCKGISIVLAFSCGQHKTIRMKYVWTRIFVFKNIRICVDKALIIRTKVYLCKSADVMYIMYVTREEQNV